MISNPPFVSIIIVSFCKKNIIYECLSSLEKTTYKYYEIIVVDNNSKDGSTELLKKKFPSVKIITLDKNYGFAAPNNKAAILANGEYIVFLNNDAKVKPNWLEPLVTTLENKKNISIAQSLLLKSNGSVDSSGDFIDNLGRAYSNHEISKDVSYILSPRAACMIIRKNVFSDLGGFDEDYFASFEDVELGWKSWLWGYKSVIIPSSVVYHDGGSTVKTISDEIAFHGVKNSISLRMTHFDLIDSFKSLALMALLEISQKLFKKNFAYNKNLINNTPKLKIIAKAIFWILINLPHIYKKRKKIRSKKIVKTEYLKNLGLITSTSFKNQY